MHRTRRAWLRLALAGSAPACALAQVAAPQAASPAEWRAWHDLAVQMRRLAESWGDQPYGAVLVLDGLVVGYGPSRVVQHQDPAAHAEREAIADAQRRLGRRRLDGSVLVSTSRPCRACERAAAAAGVARMVHGSALNDAGTPQP